MSELSQLEQVKLDAQRITLKRIRDNQEANGLLVVESKPVEPDTETEPEQEADNVKPSTEMNFGEKMKLAKAAKAKAKAKAKVNTKSSTIR